MKVTRASFVSSPSGSRKPLSETVSSSKAATFPQEVEALVELDLKLAMRLMRNRTTYIQAVRDFGALLHERFESVVLTGERRRSLAG